MDFKKKKISESYKKSGRTTKLQTSGSDLKLVCSKMRVESCHVHK